MLIDRVTAISPTVRAPWKFRPPSEVHQRNGTYSANASPRLRFGPPDIPPSMSRVAGSFNQALTLLAAIAVSCLWPVAPSSAVTIAGGSRGEALIVPVYSTENGVATLLTVTNITTFRERPAATKITFRDRDGKRLRSVNAYINAAGAWVASMEATQSGTRIEFPGPICTQSEEDGEVVPVTETEIPARTGFIEIVELGLLEGGTPASRANKVRCEELASEWSSGAWVEEPNNLMIAPTNDLKASASLINVQEGTMYSLDATALADFSHIPQHTRPGSAVPDLRSAHDSGTEAGQTRSTVCTVDGCIEETWSRPLDAVAAALLAHELEAEFVVEQAIEASSELVLTYPLRRFYESGEPFEEHDVALLTTNRKGDPIPMPEICNPPNPGEFPCERSFVLDQARSVEVIDFGQPASAHRTNQPSNILGLTHDVVVFREAVSESGTAKAGLRNLGPNLTSNEGTEYRGVPAVSVMLQRYVNGKLEDQSGNSVLANYGNAFSTARTVRAK